MVDIRMVSVGVISRTYRIRRGLGRGTDESTKAGLTAGLWQQLGLKLESTEGAVKTLIIDHAARPSGN